MLVEKLREARRAGAGALPACASCSLRYNGSMVGLSLFYSLSTLERVVV